jgi:hypothetical protein
MIHNNDNKRSLTPPYGLLLLLMVFFYPASALADKRIGEIESMEGTASISREGVSAPLDAKGGMPLVLHDQIKSGPASTLHLLFDDGSRMTLGEKADLVLDEFVFDVGKKERKAGFSLMAGKLKIFARNLMKYQRRGFQIKTPTAAAGVRGTVFLVWVIDQTITRVVCFEGILQVSNLYDPSQYVELTGGFSTDIIRNLAPSTPLLLTEEQLRELEEFTEETSTTTSTTSSTTTTTTTTTTTSQETTVSPSS